MSIIQVNHIKSNCKGRFSSLIDVSDVPATASPDDKESQFLTRALTAFAIAALAKTDDTTAANAVVDGYHDDGIDGFFFDRVEHRAYLVQSKWAKSGGGSIDLGATLQFVQGV